MKKVRENAFLVPSILILLIVMVLPLISYAVQGKTVSSAQRAPKIPNILINTCNQSYSDITLAVEQRLLQSYNLSNITITNFPIKYTSRYYLFRMSNPGRTMHYWYLYDVGLDELWLTADDITSFITDEPLGNALLAGTISETANSTEFYWSYLDITYSLAGTYVYACTLSSQGCSNQRMITVTYPPHQIMGLTLATTMNRLYLAIEDTSNINSPGDIYSCSFSPLALDDCSLGLSNYFWHVNYSFLLSAYPGAGFTYSPNIPLLPTQFFDIYAQQSSSIPQGVALDPYLAAQLNTLFFSYRVYTPPNPRVDFITVDSLGTTSTLSSDTTGIRPLLTTLTNNSIYYVYSKTNPYRQIIRTVTGLETVIYVNSTSVQAPLPFTLQKDHSVLGAYPWSTDYHIYLSDCRF